MNSDPVTVDYGGDPCYGMTDYEWQFYELCSKEDYKGALIAEGMTKVWTK